MAGEVAKATKPPVTVIAVKVFAPDKVCVPLPILFTVPPVIRPLKLAVALLSPKVRVPPPVVTVPLPLRPLMVSLNPARLRVPTPVPAVLRMTVPVPAPLGIWLAAPRVRVALLPVKAPKLTTVSPA